MIYHYMGIAWVVSYRADEYDPSYAQVQLSNPESTGEVLDLDEFPDFIQDEVMAMVLTDIREKRVA